MASAADNSVIVNISDMIDLAIGTPEVGVVDFGMLQTVLHCLAQQLRVLSKNVELRGSVAALPVGRENAQTINVSEYIVDTGEDAKSGKSGKAYKEVTEKKPSPDDSILVVERIKKADSIGRGTSPAPPSGAASIAGGGAGVVAGAAAGGGAAKTAGASGAVGTGPERLSLVTISKFNLLETTVNDIKDRVYGSMPKNEEILQEVRSQTNLKAITDMWNTLNVQSRLEAAENGIAKLSSLVEDVIANAPNPDLAVSHKASAISAKSNKSVTAGAGTADGAAGAGGAGGAAGTGGTAGAGGAAGTGGTAGAGGAQGAGGAEGTAGGAGAAGAKGAPGAAYDDTGLVKKVDKLRQDVDVLYDTFYNTMETMGVEPAEGGGGGGLSTPSAASRSSKGVSGKAAGAAGGQAGGGGQAAGGGGGQAGGGGGQARSGGQDSSTGGGGRDADATSVGGGAARRVGGGAESGGGNDGAIGDRISFLEKRIAECCEDTHRKEGVLKDKISGLEDQMEFVLKQMGVSANKDATTPQLTPDLVKDLQGLMTLFKTVQDMQQQLKQVHETALALVSEKEDRQRHINTLLEQIELLKAVKMDREDVAEAMAEKADMRALARKVSHDQFDMACDDLAKGLEQAIGKLNMQEALWQQALDDIQREIETKLDKMELSPVKEFFNNKLKQLQESLKALASLRRDVEAAGAKRKLMRDINCISCDAQVVMAMEMSNTLPQLKSLPPNLSMKPYLSYELDAIRKAQAANVPQRNMHDWENIEKQMTQPRAPQKVRSDTDKHLCNRYCGGSHTVTTPAQRVARLGHFVKQWGPDVLPLSSGLAAGDDGKMYKVVVENTNLVGPGGAVEGTCTPMKSPKEEKKAQKPLIISAECRCLEGDRGSSYK